MDSLVKAFWYIKPYKWNNSINKESTDRLGAVAAKVWLGFQARTPLSLYSVSGTQEAEGPSIRTQALAKNPSVTIGSTIPLHFLGQLLLLVAGKFLEFFPGDLDPLPWRTALGHCSLFLTQPKLSPQTHYSCFEACESIYDIFCGRIFTWVKFQFFGEPRTWVSSLHLI